MSRNAAHSPAGPPEDIRATSGRLEGQLIYLATPFSHPDPAISQHRLENVNRYAAHLLGRGKLVFPPLSHGAPIDSREVPGSVWYELGPRILKGCDELWLLALDGWEDSEGVRMELALARQLDIPVYVVNPDTHEALDRRLAAACL